MVGVVLCNDEEKDSETSSRSFKVMNRITVGVRVGT